MYQQINRAALKADARAAMRESRANPYVTALVLVAVSYLLNYLSMRVTGLYELMPQIYAYLAGAHFTEEELLQLYYRLNEPRLGGQLIDLLISAVQLMLNTGFMLFCLLAVRRAANAPGQPAGQFRHVLPHPRPQHRHQRVHLPLEPAALCPRHHRRLQLPAGPITCCWSTRRWA